MTIDSQGVGVDSYTRVTKPFRIITTNNYVKEYIDTQIVLEQWLTVFVNDYKVATLLCSPSYQELLAIGFLQSKGLIESAKDIKKTEIFREEVRVYLEKGNNLEQNTKPVISNSQLTLTVKDAIALMEKFDERSVIYHATHGVHNAAIASREEVLFFYEDIGRCNAIDKVFGKCLLEWIDTKNKVLIISARVNSVVLSKVTLRGIPVVISSAAPTDVAILEAERLGITLVSLRNSIMNIYSCPFRIV